MPISAADNGPETVGERTPSPERTAFSLGVVRVREAPAAGVEVGDGPGFAVSEAGAHPLWKVLPHTRRHRRYLIVLLN